MLPTLRSKYSNMNLMSSILDVDHEFPPAMCTIMQERAYMANLAYLAHLIY
jgi:hypothetical protein